MASENLIKKLYPDFRDVGYFFKEYLRRYVTNDTTLLDLGCGRQPFGAEWYHTAKRRVGIDPDQAALRENMQMDEKIWCTIEDIPETIGTFDLVIAQWVLEHVQHPDHVARVIGRVCKPGGHFIFMTTNIHSPEMMVSKIMPTALKKYLRKTLLHIDEEDTYPTKYRMNSVATIDRLFVRNGFQKIDVKTVGALSYFSWNTVVLRGKILFDRTIGRVFPKTHIVGVYQKVR